MRSTFSMNGLPTIHIHNENQFNASKQIQLRLIQREKKEEIPSKQ